MTTKETTQMMTKTTKKHKTGLNCTRRHQAAAAAAADAAPPPRGCLVPFRMGGGGGGCEQSDCLRSYIIVRINTSLCVV